MIVAAFSYLYTKRQFPARGILAWAVLSEEGSYTVRKEAVRRLARLFNISATNARVLLRRGEGIFWRLTSRNVRPYSSHRLWLAVAAESNVPEDEYVNVPEEALLSIAVMRAYLAQPALTRGPTKPVSVAVSAQLLERGRRAVGNYRKRLACAGRLQAIPQYERLREQQLNFHAPPIENGEFVNKGWIYRRTADIVVITNSMGDILTWPVHRVKGRTLAPRRYFIETKQLERWVARGKSLAKDAVLRIFDDWVAVTNVLNAVRENVIYTTIPLYRAQNVHRKPPLVKPPGMAYSNSR